MINSRVTVATYKSLKCWYTNADSLPNKFCELKSRLTIDKPDIVAITEVNCKIGCNNIEFNNGYKTIQNTTRQCSVCIFVKSDLHSYKDDILNSSSFLESLWCRISLTNKDCLLFGVVYRSPNSTNDNIQNLCSLLTQAVSHLLYCWRFQYASYKLEYIVCNIEQWLWWSISITTWWSLYH